MGDHTPILQTVANIFAIIAGAAAVATLVLVWLDRRTRITLSFRIDYRERVAGEGGIPRAVFEIDSRGRARVFILRSYLVLNSRGSRFTAFENMPGESGADLLPENPPAELYVKMEELAQALIEAGAIFTAEAKFVVEDADRKPYELKVVVRDLQKWARGGGSGLK